LRYQANGKPELSLRLSVSNGERDGKRFSLPVDVTVFGQACESLAESLERDDLVELTGQTTWPKPSRKPGGTAIPAVVCFGVTKLSGVASTEHERSPEYVSEEVEVASPTETHEPAAEPPAKPRKPRYSKALGKPWTPSGLVSEN
jgi:hypothetical protein